MVGALKLNSATARSRGAVIKDFFITELAVMTETTPFTVDTDDELLPEVSDVLLREDSEEEESSCCARPCRRTARPLSVQSGDIIRSSQREGLDVPKSRFYNFVFPILHKIVRKFLFREPRPLSFSSCLPSLSVPWLCGLSS